MALQAEMRGQEREELGSAIASVRKALELLKWPALSVKLNSV